MLTSVFVGTSLDGFIARLDGSFDFLDAAGNIPHGYDEFIATVDCLVIGRKTFEIILGFPDWPYGNRQVIVLSSHPIDLSPVRAHHVEHNVEQMSGSPGEICTNLAARGLKHAYVDGGITVQRFLSAGMVQRITISRVPVLIGQGIPLFGSLPHDIHLRHIATRTYPTGLVKTEYEILPK